MNRENAIEVRLIAEEARKDFLARYSLTQSAMKGLFHRALLEHTRPNTQAQTQLDQSLKKIVSTASKIEREAIRVTTSNIEKASIADVSEEDLQTRADEYHSNIARQLGVDARAISGLFRRTQLRLQSTVVPKEETYSQAIVAIDSESLSYYKDTKGRKWRPEHYLITQAGQYYYGLANDLSVSQAMASGKKTMTLDRPGHVSDGSLISTQSLEKARDVFLHPGSQGILY